MSTDAAKTAEGPGKVGPPPVRAVVFSMLSVLVECAAGNIGAGVPSVGGTEEFEGRQGGCDLEESRLAIDAANALLAAVGRSLSSDERHAIEGLLTQLQIEYVKRSRA